MKAKPFLLLTVQTFASLSTLALWHKFDEVDVSSNAIALPTLPNNDTLPANTPIGPEFMLVRGSGIWSSDPGVAETASSLPTTVTLKLHRPIRVQGLHIEWFTPPESFRVRSNSQTDLIPWTKLTDAEESTDTIFTVIKLVDSLTLELKASAERGRVAINYIAAITPKITLVMIVSGITIGQEEFCLSRIGTEVFMVSCLTEIGRHGGNELWRLDDKTDRIYHAITGLILGVSKKGNSVILSSEDDIIGDAGFRINEENQLVYKVGNETKTCLTLLGKGVKDIIKSQFRPITASGGEGGGSSPKLLVDGDLESTWISMSNSKTNKFSVTLTINLESISETTDRVKEILILWKYPAESFIISGSHDGILWTVVQSLQGNRILQTLIQLNPNQTYLNYKIELTAVHKKLGKITSHSWAYGIREIEIRFYGLSLSLGSSCDDVYKESYDGRNFFFYKGVDNFDLNVMEQIQGMTNQYRDHKNDLTRSADHLEELDLETCSSRVGALRGSLSDMEETESRISKYLKSQLDDLLVGRKYPTRCSEIDSFRTELLHAGLFEEYQIYPVSSSYGFVPIQPRCSKIPTRLFCPSGHTLYTSEMQSAETKARLKIYSLDGAQRLCSSIGLEPNPSKLLLSNEGIELLKILVQSSNICAYPTFIPLAYSRDVLGLRWTDLSNTVDLTESVYSLLGQNDRTQGLSQAPLFGYNCQMFTFADWNTDNLRAIVCAEERMNIEPRDLPQISCTETLKTLRKASFSSIPSTYSVSCPDRCFETLFARRKSDYVNGLVIGVAEHGYSENSSICLSAHHAGLISSHRNSRNVLLNISINAALSSYGKGTANGITSRQDSDSTDEYSFKVQSLQPPCSGAQETTTTNISAHKGKNITDDIRQPLKLMHESGSSSDGEQTDKVYEPREDSSNQRALKLLLKSQGLIYENINDYQTHQLLALNQEIIMEARGWMKPIEKNYQGLTTRFENLSSMYKKASLQLSKVMRSVLIANEHSKSILAAFERSKERHGSSSKKLIWREFSGFYESTIQMSLPLARSTSPQTTTDFGSYQLISLIQLGQTFGTSISSNGLEDSDDKLILYQPNANSAGLPAEPCNTDDGSGLLFVGNILIFQNQIKYDGVLSAKFLNPQDPMDRSRIGLVAKFKDFNNMLLGILEQNSEGGTAKFLSVINGREDVIGSIEWNWSHLRNWFQLSVIKSKRDHFSLYIKSDKPDQVHLLTIQSEQWAGRGAFGVYANFATPVMITRVEFKPSECAGLNSKRWEIEAGDNSVVHHMPEPARCSLYEESFQNFGAHWGVGTSDGGVVDWRIEFVRDRLAFVQRNSVRRPGASLVARPPLGCEIGQIKFAYSSPCEHFYLSVMLKSTDEITITENSIIGGNETDRVDMNTEAKVDEWTEMRIVLANESATIFDAQNHSYPFELSTSSHKQGFGFSVADCGGFAISNIQLQPLDNDGKVEVVAEKVESMNTTSEIVTAREQAPMLASFLELTSQKSWADIFVNKEEL